MAANSFLVFTAAERTTTTSGRCRLRQWRGVSPGVGINLNPHKASPRIEVDQSEMIVTGGRLRVVPEGARDTLPTHSRGGHRTRRSLRLGHRLRCVRWRASADPSYGPPSELGQRR